MYNDHITRERRVKPKDHTKQTLLALLVIIVSFYAIVWNTLFNIQ